MEGDWEERERGNGGGRERKQRDRVLALCVVEKHCLAPWHTQEHTHTHANKQNTHTCTEHQRLFKLLIKRLAPSSYALKLAEGVCVQEILAFLTHGLKGEPGSSNTSVILIQFLMVRLTRFGPEMGSSLSDWCISPEGLKAVKRGGIETERAR